MQMWDILLIPLGYGLHDAFLDTIMREDNGSAIALDRTQNTIYLFWVARDFDCPHKSPAAPPAIIFAASDAIRQNWLLIAALQPLETIPFGNPGRWPGLGCGRAVGATKPSKPMDPNSTNQEEDSPWLIP